MQNTEWLIAPTRIEVYQSLHESLKISEIVCRLLDIRGIRDYDSARRFFRPVLTDCHDPFLMKDMILAVSRIRLAFEQKEKILIYGDYDVDGTTSVAMLYHYLCSIYEKKYIDFYIPNRYKEGYGLSQRGIQYAIESKSSLLICIDCGIRSNALIDEAKQYGIDTIICDHHLPGDTLPPAVAILNPKQPDCPYPYKELCGCGIGFKWIDALQSQLNPNSIVHHQYLDWVACAIAADMVNMDGENRTLAHYGIKKINENPSVSIRAMLDVAGHQQKVSVSNVVFVIAPRINAAGRMDDARKVVEFLLENDPKLAREMAAALQVDNSERREVESDQSAEALKMVTEDKLFSQKMTTVLYAPHWLKGVVGIMASRLQENFFRPTVVLTNSDGVISGSARSIPEINICEAIGECSEHLIQYGGHAAAAGLTLLPKKLDAFKEKFEAVVKEKLFGKFPRKTLNIDLEISLSQLNTSLLNLMSQMEPFGPKNMNPLFVSYRVRCCRFPKKLKEKHVKFSVTQDGYTYECIGFGLAHKFELLQIDREYDIVYHAEWNEFNNEKKIQLRLLDFRPC